MKIVVLSVISFLALSLMQEPATALPAPLPGKVQIGDAFESVLTALKEAGLAGLKVSTPEIPQALSDGLIRDDLQLLLNRANADRAFVEEPVKNRLRFIRAETGGDSIVLAFASEKLRAVIWKAHVAVDSTVGGDQNPFRSERLAPVRGFQDRLKQECSLKQVDEASPVNHFIHSGTCGRQTRIYMEYHPGQDEYRVLFYS